LGRPRLALAAAFNIPFLVGFKLLGVTALRSLVAVHTVAKTKPIVDMTSSVASPAPGPNLHSQKTMVEEGQFPFH
jgi:hypothetical protein